MEDKEKRSVGRPARPDRKSRNLRMSDAVYEKARVIGGGNPKAVSDGVEVAIMAYKINNQVE